MPPPGSLSVAGAPSSKALCNPVCLSPVQNHDKMARDLPKLSSQERQAIPWTCPSWNAVLRQLLQNPMHFPEGVPARAPAKKQLPELRKVMAYTGARGKIEYVLCLLNFVKTQRKRASCDTRMAGLPKHHWNSSCVKCVCVSVLHKGHGGVLRKDETLGWTKKFKVCPRSVLPWISSCSTRDLARKGESRHTFSERRHFPSVRNRMSQKSGRKQRPEEIIAKPNAFSRRSPGESACQETTARTKRGHGIHEGAGKK